MAGYESLVIATMGSPTKWMWPENWVQNREVIAGGRPVSAGNDDQRHYG
jgi:hypothetical protein